MSSTISIDLGTRSYTVHVENGLLDRAGAMLKSAGITGKLFVVTDETVARLHGAALQRALAAEGYTSSQFAVPPGEQSKSFAVLQDLAERMAQDGVTRRDTVIGFGGGVIGDVAGFAAATMLRGLDFMQVPTTLLAQVDSSVGGKTGINLEAGKNLVGAFHQPKLVLIDPSLLGTLDMRQRRAGAAEIVKMALLGDASFFGWLEQNAAALLRTGAVQKEAILRAVRMKAEIVARDEFEQNERMLLNLGHTFGHALEAFAGYGAALLHGEAVAIGIAMAFRFAEQNGGASAEDVRRVQHLLTALGLSSHVSDMRLSPQAEDLLGLMARDKKNSSTQTAPEAHAERRQTINLILPQGIGAAHVVPVAADALLSFLKRDLKAAS